MSGILQVTVSQLNTYIRARLEEDSRLSDLFVTGEISNFTDHYRSGHFYLSLKDEKSVIRAVMFSSYARRLRFHPQDGMKVIARGHVSVYEPNGQYQLYIEDMQPDGLGALHMAYEQLKEKLEREGLFSAERKKVLPLFPERIGIVTSPTGAAVHDMLTILERRFPMAEVVFCPVLVQGEEAAGQIVEALARLNREKAADVILLGRGGGSLEDLWAFNEERLVRAVAASRIPVISAVGHETDFTICDFVADLRAPTPSAAAELAVPDQEELFQTLFSFRQRMQKKMEDRLGWYRQRLDSMVEHSALCRPVRLVEKKKEKIHSLEHRLEGAMEKKLLRARSLWGMETEKLHALSPLSILKRGFALVEDANGQLRRKASELAPGDLVSLRFSDGRVRCLIQEKTLEKGSASISMQNPGPDPFSEKNSGPNQ